MTIQFQGKEYASQAAMPPDVSQAYEEFLLEQELGEAEAQQARTDPAAQPLPRAWGGSRPDGGVPVPVEFDDPASSPSSEHRMRQGETHLFAAPFVAVVSVSDSKLPAFPLPGGTSPTRLVTSDAAGSNRAWLISTTTGDRGNRP